jgi:hypothetical protein
MTSNINPNNIDGSYPVAGQDNNSQGFRDNFTNIKVNFQDAEAEINDLQAKAVLKSALTGGTLDNNMLDNLIYAAKIQDFSGTKVTVTSTSGAISINYASGHYQSISTSGSISLSFVNFPGTGSYGYIKLQIEVTNIAHTVTLPSSVTLGVSGLQGISPTPPAAGPYTLSFSAAGTYEFAFGTYNGGSTVTIFDLNRALTNFSAADLQVDDVTATGNIIAGSGGVGFVSATGNVLASQQVIATGNVTGGNLVTAGSVSATGTITGGNLVIGNVTATGNLNGAFLNSRVRPNIGTTTLAALQLTAGDVLSTPGAGAFEYDGIVFYTTPTASRRGLAPSVSFRVQATNNTISDTTSAQAVFSSPSAITLDASTAYMFEAVYYITRAAGTTSHTLSTLFALGGTLTSMTYTADTTSTTGNALGAVSRIYGTGATATVVTAASTSATENITVVLRGIIKTNAGGTLTPQIQYSAAPGGAPTVLANSYIKLVPLGTSAVASIGSWA